MAPARHLPADVLLDLLGQLLKEGAGGTSTAWTGDHRGGEGAQLQRLQDLLGDDDLLGPVPARLRGEGDADGVTDPLLQQHRQRGGGGDDALGAHSRLGQSQVQGIVASCRQFPIDTDQILYAAHLAGKDDVVVGKSQLFCLGRALQCGADQRLLHHLGGLSGLRQLGVFVHQATQHRLIQAAPVDADTDGLVVTAGDPDHRSKLFVPFPAPSHVSGVDAILCQCGGTRRMLRQQLVAVEVEIPHQRGVDSHPVEPVADRGDAGGRLGAVDRNPHQLRACLGQFGDLPDRGLDICGVGVGHGLHHHRRISPHDHMADVDRNGAVTFSGLDGHGTKVPNGSGKRPILYHCPFAPAPPAALPGNGVVLRC